MAGVKRGLLPTRTTTTARSGRQQRGISGESAEDDDEHAQPTWHGSGQLHPADWQARLPCDLLPELLSAETDSARKGGDCRARLFRQPGTGTPAARAGPAGLARRAAGARLAWAGGRSG